MSCELCAPAAEVLLWHGQRCRAILVEDAGYPGFCRVIWNDHIKEMTDLSMQMRAELMHVVFAVESAVREVMRPEKINLASLGNMVPHLHWHIIPRYVDDSHFPNPVWAEPVRKPRITIDGDVRARLGASILKHLTA